MGIPIMSYLREVKEFHSMTTHREIQVEMKFFLKNY